MACAISKCSGITATHVTACIAFPGCVSSSSRTLGTSNVAACMQAAFRACECLAGSLYTDLFHAQLRCMPLQ